ncbi:glycosyltransferase family 2 protein [Patescibacteria group bacterium]|nr:glycosyltransferase family 2 protein [Patescibacteria group bacterium]MBU2264745.1 glycosyltransferase family 2 protein [Patescibacteria group bacterium]
MENNPYLSVIIPAYNEEKRISKTLLAVDQYLQKQNFEYEILVVSDGSTDKTAEIAEDFKRNVKNLKLIDNQANHGKGWVTRQGMLAAEGQIRLFMDADNATTLDHFDKMKSYFDNGSQVVIGSRDAKDAKGAKQAVPQSGFKRLLGNMGNILIQVFAVWGIWDTQCGFKAFSAEAAKAVFSKSKIDRWGFDIEALALARKLKYKIEVVPVYWINDPHSKVSLKGYLMTFKELFQVWWWLVRDVYKLKM